MSFTHGEVREVLADLEEICCQALTEDCRLDKATAVARLEAELDYYRGLKVEQHSISEVFRRFCVSLANRDRMFSLIYGGDESFPKTERAFGDVLLGFEPKRILAKYDNDGTGLLRDLIAVRGLEETSATHQIESKGSLFRIFARGVLAGARYFAQYKHGRDFAAAIQSWRQTPEMVSRLPDYLSSQDIPGLGPALAADFLKEIGVQELGKPDGWVRSIMGKLGWIDDGAPAARVQDVFWDISRLAGERYSPVVIDKLMYLVGTGKFVMVTPQYWCRSRFDEFAQRVTLRAARPHPDNGGGAE